MHTCCTAHSHSQLGLLHRRSGFSRVKDPPSREDSWESQISLGNKQQYFFSFEASLYLSIWPCVLLANAIWVIVNLGQVFLFFFFFAPTALWALYVTTTTQSGSVSLRKKKYLFKTDISGFVFCFFYPPLWWPIQPFIPKVIPAKGCWSP